MHLLAERKVAGPTLRELRKERGFSLDDVVAGSKKNERDYNDERLRFSKSWLARLERGQSSPNDHVLKSLSLIYNLRHDHLRQLYNRADSLSNPPPLTIDAPKTHQVLRELPDVGRVLDVLAEKATNGQFDKTALVSSLAEPWRGELQASLEHKDHLYGKSGPGVIIGKTDEFMYHLLRPCTLVRIDTSQTRPERELSADPGTRQIFYVETREGNTCCYCQQAGRHVLLIPYLDDQQHSRVRSLSTDDIDIIGRVIRVEAMRLDAVPLQTIKAKAAAGLAGNLPDR